MKIIRCNLVHAAGNDARLSLDEKAHSAKMTLTQYGLLVDRRGQAMSLIPYTSIRDMLVDPTEGAREEKPKTKAEAAPKAKEA